MLGRVEILPFLGVKFPRFIARHFQQDSRIGMDVLPRSRSGTARPILIAVFAVQDCFRNLATRSIPRRNEQNKERRRKHEELTREEGKTNQLCQNRQSWIRPAMVSLNLSVTNVSLLHFRLTLFGFRTLPPYDSSLLLSLKRLIIMAK